MKIRNGFVSNSSSSSFICKTDLSVTEVSEKLHKIHQLYCEIYDDESSFTDCYEEPLYLTDAEKKEYFKYWTTHYEIPEGNIIINSASDNSIPFDLFDMIENAFNARRIHLG